MPQDCTCKPSGTGTAPDKHDWSLSGTHNPSLSSPGPQRTRLPSDEEANEVLCPMNEVNSDIEVERPRFNLRTWLLAYAQVGMLGG